MSLTTAQLLRPISAPVVVTSSQVSHGRAASAQSPPASGKLTAPLPTVDPVILQGDVVSLSRQGLQARGVDPSGSATLDFSQSLLFSFASRLSRVSGGADGGLGSVSAARFQLGESASFTGTGQITSNDGKSFDFEIEVRYQTEIDAQISQLTGSPASDTALALPDALALTGKALPAIEFPGSLSDLFKLLGRELSGSIGKDGKSAGGDLTLRLLRLVDRAALLAPRLRPDESHTPPVERAKVLVNAYSGMPGPGQLTSA